MRADALRGRVQHFQRLGGRGMQGAPRLGQEDGPVAALEQCHAERLLQLANLAADRAVGQVQFVRSPHETLVPRRGLEETDPAQPVHACLDVSVYLTDFHEYKWVVGPSTNSENA